MQNFECSDSAKLPESSSSHYYLLLILTLFLHILLLSSSLVGHSSKTRRNGKNGGFTHLPFTSQLASSSSILLPFRTNFLFIAFAPLPALTLPSFGPITVIDRKSVV